MSQSNFFCLSHLKQIKSLKIPLKPKPYLSFVIKISDLVLSTSIISRISLTASTLIIIVSNPNPPGYCSIEKIMFKIGAKGTLLLVPQLQFQFWATLQYVQLWKRKLLSETF